MVYLLDRDGHLVCWPYSVADLRHMAGELGLDPADLCFAPHPHYCVPEEHLARVAGLAILCTLNDLLIVCHGLGPPQTRLLHAPPGHQFRWAEDGSIDYVPARKA